MVETCLCGARVAIETALLNKLVESRNQESVLKAEREITDTVTNQKPWLLVDRKLYKSCCVVAPSDASLN